ncbi:MAG: fumarate reductase subunit C [Pseudohongiella sp.]|nr:fumarate reductase subunit C [Pseudohongiella sp.]MDO9519962.1 fumarate reductase subunit C [Pseudohongiella sp.]
MPSHNNSRRPYLPAFRRDWWLQLRFYQLYMLREATVLPLLFFISCLIYGLYSLSQGESQWLKWLDFMARPWVVALNVLTLAASLFHAKTFFELFPRVMPLAPPSLMIAVQWLATVVVAGGFVVLLGAWV